MLDGLSHKEIGALLGIDPHSSSSQLSRAKAMLRRMIMDYRAGILLLAGLVSTVVVWQLTRQDADGGPGPHIADSQMRNPPRFLCNRKVCGCRPMK